MNLILLLPFVNCVLVNPLPKPVSIDWLNDGEKWLDLGLLVRMLQFNYLVLWLFFDMVDTLDRLKWYPSATEPPTYPTRKYPRMHLTELVINISDYDVDLQYGVDESYNLTITDDIVIDAFTIWGALHAFKTLQQLVMYERGDNGQGGVFKIELGVRIRDYPLLKHRGVLIDSGRNYLSLDAIKQNIDLMSLTKLNVLHWHLQDTSSWPLEIKTFPEMVLDAYSSLEIYTQQEVSELIAYARTKGVRIVPEIDLPGHANAGWHRVDSNIVVCHNESWRNVAQQPPPGQLNIFNNKTYEIVEKVFLEVNALFPDNFFHIGHDEVNANCYNSSFPDVFIDFMQYWLEKSQSIFLNKNTTLIMWEDIASSLTTDLPYKNNVVLQSWLGDGNIKKLTLQGYDIIVSSHQHYYLDCGFGGWITNDPFSGSWCAYSSWQNIYSYDPYVNLTSAEAEHIVGAEIALWGETVDSRNLISKLWARAGAFAEVAWSGNKPSGVIRLREFTQRMFNFREYIVALGYMVDPLAPKHCWQVPHSCDS